MACHDLSVGTSRADGKQIATLGGGQLAVVGKHIAALADGTHHIIGLGLFLADQIFNAMFGIVERRSYQVSHSGIHDCELLVLGLLDIKAFSN